MGARKPPKQSAFPSVQRMKRNPALGIFESTRRCGGWRQARDTQLFPVQFVLDTQVGNGATRACDGERSQQAEPRTGSVEFADAVLAGRVKTEGRGPTDLSSDRFDRPEVRTP